MNDSKLRSDMGVVHVMFGHDPPPTSLGTHLRAGFRVKGI
jgi:hypothetical protein